MSCVRVPERERVNEIENVILCEREKYIQRVKIKIRILLRFTDSERERVCSSAFCLREIVSSKATFE